MLTGNPLLEIAIAVVVLFVAFLVAYFYDRYCFKHSIRKYEPIFNPQESWYRTSPESWYGASPNKPPPVEEPVERTPLSSWDDIHEFVKPVRKRRAKIKGRIRNRPKKVIRNRRRGKR